VANNGQLAEDDLKAIGASFSQLITATMISRLVLNLRASSMSPPTSGVGYTQSRARLMDRTIGNLGEKLESFLDMDDNSERSVASNASYVNDIALVDRHKPYRKA
jgi:hypothetical protein